LIITAATLDRAKLRWQFLKPDQDNRARFRVAVTVLDEALCQSDVDFGLAFPDFLVRRIQGVDPDIYEVVVDGELMLAYRLIDGNPGAEVEIL
jgi:hypothetical protein